MYRHTHKCIRTFFTRYRFILTPDQVRIVTLLMYELIDSFVSNA